jgi:hypothetical protein
MSEPSSRRPQADVYSAYGLHQPDPSLPFRPANAEWPRVDLPTWSCNSGTKSANEVAQITNKKNNSLKEGASTQFGAKQNAKSY